jgi:hypothetical protein
MAAKVQSQHLGTCPVCGYRCEVRPFNPHSTARRCLSHKIFHGNEGRVCEGSGSLCKEDKIVVNPDFLGGK